MNQNTKKTPPSGGNAGILGKVLQARAEPPTFSLRTPQFSIRKKVVVPGSMASKINRIV